MNNVKNYSDAGELLSVMIKQRPTGHILRKLRVQPSVALTYSGMPKPVTVSFLGTSSGGGPTEKRACSSLVLDLAGGQELWMVDCAEGTLRQFHHQRLGLKPGKVKKIFITHIHHHCIGIPTFLGNLLRGQLQAQPDSSIRSKPPKIELFGPAGLRALVRTILTMTSTVLNEPYVVHELLRDTDVSTSCEQSQMHGSELEGRDIRCNEDGLWRNILYSRFGKVDAGPLEHRIPCLGYVFTTINDTPNGSRKIAVLGDSGNSTRIAPLSLDADLLVHEATDASIPTSVDVKAKEHKRTPAFVETQAKQRGHSTPRMAGEFAKSIRAKQLVLNHIGARFPPVDGPDTRNTCCIQEIERQATVASGLPSHAVQAAYDFLVVDAFAMQKGHPKVDRRSGSNDRKSHEPDGYSGSSGRPRKRVKH